MVYAITEEKQPDGPVDLQRIWGASVAVRREIFDKGLRFNANVDPASGNYIMGSETKLASRLADEGYSCNFCNASVVEHIIRSYQLSEAWLWRRSLHSGKSYCLNNIANHRQQQFRILFGVPIWIVNRYIIAYFSYAYCSFIGNSDLAFANAIQRIPVARLYPPSV